MSLNYHPMRKQRSKSRYSINGLNEGKLLIYQNQTQKRSLPSRYYLLSKCLKLLLEVMNLLVVYWMAYLFIFCIIFMQNSLKLHRRFLSLNNITKIKKEDECKSLQELGICHHFILSLSLVFEIQDDDKCIELESPNCKDLNDLYVLIYNELNVQSFKLYINSKLVPAMQYPPVPLQTYLARNVPISITRVMKQTLYYVGYHHYGLLP